MYSFWMCYVCIGQKTLVSHEYEGSVHVTDTRCCLMIQLVVNTQLSSILMIHQRLWPAGLVCHMLLECHE